VAAIGNPQQQPHPSQLQELAVEAMAKTCRQHIPGIA
jgi:hypothetical protein